MEFTSETFCAGDSFLWNRDGHSVPDSGTKGGFTTVSESLILALSSSGGGLFGRPMI